MSTERFFYHSFPRRDTANDAKGLAILRSLVDIGLLLVPEQVAWKGERLIGGGFSTPDYVKQVRVCFTELAPSELLQHSAQFGEFALEFEISTLRQFGAFPVIYLPPDSGDANSAAGAATTSVVRMSQLTRVLDRILGLKSFLRDNPRIPSVSITVGDDFAVDVPADALAAVLTSLERGVQSFEQLHASLRILTSFFYPTENIQYNETLHYYRQREWRIGAGLVIGGQPTTRPIRESEKTAVVAIDREFFEGILEFRNIQHKRIDLCHVMPHFQNEPVISHARRLIVPSRARDSASAVLHSLARVPQVATLEEL